MPPVPYRCYDILMKSIYLWHGAIGIALVTVGIGIIGAVAYLLYGSEFAADEPSGATLFMCGEVTVQADISDDSARITLPERTVELEYTPPEPGAETGPIEWRRYATEDGALVFWHAEGIAFVEENGRPLYGECRAQNLDESR